MMPSAGKDDQRTHSVDSLEISIIMFRSFFSVSKEKHITQSKKEKANKAWAGESISMIV